jgi:glycosyltransferase involved in cell wall biosynthesis
MAILVAHLSERHDVTLMTLEPAGTPSFYALPDSVRIVQANLLGGRGFIGRTVRILARFLFIRRQVGNVQPDVVLSFMDTMNIATIIGCLGSGASLMISERVDPLHYRIGAWKNLLRRWLYPLADCCVVQTERVKAYFDWLPRTSLAVIANPVAIPLRQAEPAVAGDQGRFRIIAMGRLAEQKGFDRLVDAFARIADDYPSWELFIFGNGPEQAALESQIASHKLTGRVHLAGVTTDAAGQLAGSHIMAFPSRFEGFPNALAEGLAAGLPAVGYVEVSGVEELILEGETGLLVEPAGDASGLAGALRRLMDDPELRASLGRTARRHMENWRSDIICARWEQQLAAVAGKDDRR